MGLVGLLRWTNAPVRDNLDLTSTHPRYLKSHLSLTLTVSLSSVTLLLPCQPTGALEMIAHGLVNEHQVHPSMLLVLPYNYILMVADL